jgi:hypothetical protein
LKFIMSNFSAFKWENASTETITFLHVCY